MPILARRPTARRKAAVDTAESAFYGQQCQDLMRPGPADVGHRRYGDLTQHLVFARVDRAIPQDVVILVLQLLDVGLYAL